MDPGMKYSKGHSAICESCKYHVNKNDSRFVDCMECGTYNICDYCFYDFKEKKEQN